MTDPNAKLISDLRNVSHCRNSRHNDVAAHYDAGSPTYKGSGKVTILHQGLVNYEEVYSRERQYLNLEHCLSNCWLL